MSQKENVLMRLTTIFFLLFVFLFHNLHFVLAADLFLEIYFISFFSAQRRKKISFQK